jgi:hypothetical protein
VIIVSVAIVSNHSLTSHPDPLLESLFSGSNALAVKCGWEIRGSGQIGNLSIRYGLARLFLRDGVLTIAGENSDSNVMCFSFPLASVSDYKVLDGSLTVADKFSGADFKHVILHLSQVPTLVRKGLLSSRLGLSLKISLVTTDMEESVKFLPNR